MMGCHKTLIERVSRLDTRPGRTRGYATGIVLSKVESVNCGLTVVLRQDWFEHCQMDPVD